MHNVHGGDIYSYEKIIDFSANINPFDMPNEITAAVTAAVQSLGNYPDCTCRKLRQKIAKKINCSPNDIICGNGAADLIFSLVYAHKPKKALLIAPGFAEYETALLAEETQTEYFFLSPDDDFKLSCDFEKRLLKDFDMVFLCNPNNPTGVLLEKERLIRIADICEERGILLVIDECFNEFLSFPKRYSMLDELDGRKQLVILKSFTKMFAIAGLRLGYAVSKNKELLSRVYSARQPWSVSSPAQAAGLAALEQDEFEEFSACYLNKERKYLEKELRQLGCRVFDGSANFVFFRSVAKLKEKLLKKDILIRDCSNYKGLTEGFYRVAVKKHDDNVRLLNAMRQILREEI